MTGALLFLLPRYQGGDGSFPRIPNLFLESVQIEYSGLSGHDQSFLFHLKLRSENFSLMNYTCMIVCISDFVLQKDNIDNCWFFVI